MESLFQKAFKFFTLWNIFYDTVKKFLDQCKNNIYTSINKSQGIYIYTINFYYYTRNKTLHCQMFLVLS